MNPRHRSSHWPNVALPALFLLAALGACRATSSVEPIPPDFEVSIGSGGGITGGWRIVRLRPDSSLFVEFRTAGHLEAEVAAGRLDDAPRREAWTLLQATTLSALGCEPGNMTEEVEMRAGGVTQRACAPMGGGSPEFRRVHDALERLIAAPAASVQPPPPPLPALPVVLCLEVKDASGRSRAARLDSPLPPKLAENARRLADADMVILWRAVFDAGFYSGASIEERDGVPLPGAPYSCGADVSVRVTSGTDATWETRQRCVEGDAQMAALADAIVRATRR
jgi:hypothetical protein